MQLHKTAETHRLNEGCFRQVDLGRHLKRQTQTDSSEGMFGVWYGTACARVRAMAAVWRPAHLLPDRICHAGELLR